MSSIESPKQLPEQDFLKQQERLKKNVLGIGIIAVLIFLGGVGSSVYFYNKYQSSKNVLGNSTKAAAEEGASLIKKVSKLIELPKGENPTIATVSDINKLKGQTFFKNAKNGDKVLIYTKAKKAILYDPKDNKIIEAQIINIGDPTPQASSSATPTTAQTVSRIVLLNGTRTVGLATTTEKILSASKNIKVVLKEDAKANYIKTLVIDLTGKNAPAVVELAKVLKGEVGKLPVTEVEPTGADILVILGGK